MGLQGQPLGRQVHLSQRPLDQTVGLLERQLLGRKVGLQVLEERKGRVDVQTPFNTHFRIQREAG